MKYTTINKEWKTTEMKQLEAWQHYVNMHAIVLYRLNYSNNTSKMIEPIHMISDIQQKANWVKIQKEGNNKFSSFNFCAHYDLILTENFFKKHL
jgi:hypothetical protein